LGSWNISPRSALGAGDRPVADPQLARGGLVETGDQAQQRRFAAATGSDQRHQFPRRDRQRQAVEGLYRRAIGREKVFADVSHQQ